VFTDPNWADKDEDSKSSISLSYFDYLTVLGVDSGYKSDETTLKQSQPRTPFGLCQENRNSTQNPPSFMDQDFDFNEAISNPASNLSQAKSSPEKHQNSKLFTNRHISQDFWNDMNSVDF